MHNKRSYQFVNRAVLLVLTSALVCLLGRNVFANDTNDNGPVDDRGCVEANAECVQVGKWEFAIGIGGGVRTNPITGGDDLPVIVLPKLSFYGKRFFVENFSAGFFLAQSKRHEISLILGAGQEHIYFDDWGIGNVSLGSIGSSSGSLSGTNAPPVTVNDPGTPIVRTPMPQTRPSAKPMPQATPPAAPQPVPTPMVDNSGGPWGWSVINGSFGQETSFPPLPREQPPQVSPAIQLDNLRDRKMALLAGVDYRYYHGPLTLGIQALSDVSSVHGGEELRVAAAFDVPMNRHHINISLGAVWQSDTVLDYYYGIHRDDGTDRRLLYRAESGISPFTRVDWFYRINDKWTWQTSMSYRGLSESVRQSPLIGERGASTFFTGGVYHF